MGEERRGERGEEKMVQGLKERRGENGIGTKAEGENDTRAKGERM